MRQALLFILVLVSLSCQSKKDKKSVILTEPVAELIEVAAIDTALVQEKINLEKVKEEKLKVEKELEALEQKRIVEGEAKKKAATRRKAAAKRKAAKEQKKVSKAIQPDFSTIKPDASDPMTTVNPAVKEKIIKQEELEQLTEIAFKRNFYTFGEIVEGDTIDFSFSFTNIGEHPLYIKSATATCGCTHPSYSFLPVAPGEKGEITGMYVSTGKYGAQNPMVMVKSNTDPTVNKLYLDGNVIDKPAKAAPIVSDLPEADLKSDSLNIGG